MTLTLEISPETEAWLQREAQARGVSMEALALERLSEPALHRERRAILARLRGVGANRNWTSHDFLRERHEEAQREAAKSEASAVR